MFFDNYPNCRSIESLTSAQQTSDSARGRFVDWFAERGSIICIEFKVESKQEFGGNREMGSRFQSVVFEGKMAIYGKTISYLHATCLREKMY